MSQSRAAVIVPRDAGKRGAVRLTSASAGGTERKPASGPADEADLWRPPYLALYRASPIERIAMIKKGVPASQVKRLFADMRIGQAVGLKALKLSAATVNKKAKKGEALSSEESERVIGFARLVGQVEAMIEESGDGTDFDACAWTVRWMTGPVPALGGACPINLVETMEGQALISTMFARMQSGAYT